MSLLAEVKLFNAPDEDGTDNVSLDSSYWGSNAPKTHLVAGPTTTGVSTDIRSSVGWASNADDVAIGLSSVNGLTVTKVDRIHTNAYCAHPLIADGGTYEQASQSAYSAATVQHQWSNNSGDQEAYWLLALGGSDLTDVSIDTIDSPTTATEVSYTGPGFKPDFLVVFYQLSTSIPTTTVHIANGFGMSDGSTDAGIYVGSRDAVSADTVTSSVLTSDFIHSYAISSLADYEIAKVASLDASGYTLDWTQVGGTVRKYSVVAVAGPAAKVVHATQPTTPGTQDISAGFAPKAGISLGVMKTSSESASNHNRFQIGAWSESDVQAVAGWMDEDGQSQSDSDRFSTTSGSQQAVKNYNHAQSVVGQAVVAAQGNGIRETWASTDGTQYSHAWLLLGDTPTAGNPWYYKAQQGGM